MNIGNESWHCQAIEQDGFGTWVAQGRPRPAPGFPLPCTEPPPPPLVFDPANGLFGLWPVHPSKPLLSTEAFAMVRRERADTRWVWTGDAVRYAQAVVGAKVDGWFGPQTKAAVEEFQQGARVTVDGLIGPQTWALIDRQAS